MRMWAVVIVSTIAAMLLAAGAAGILRPASLAPEALARDYGGPPSKFVTLPGGTVARYHDFLADTEGDTLVLLHGGSMSLESFAPWIERLRGTMRIVAVDLPGHGLTGATTEGNYGPDGMVAFMESFVSTLGLRQPFVLAGHSMGGTSRGVSRFVIPRW